MRQLDQRHDCCVYLILHYVLTLPLLFSFVSSTLAKLVYQSFIAGQHGRYTGCVTGIDSCDLYGEV